MVDDILTLSRKVQNCLHQLQTKFDIEMLFVEVFPEGISYISAITLNLAQTLEDFKEVYFNCRSWEVCRKVNNLRRQITKLFLKIICSRFRYKIATKTSEDDFERRIKFCERLKYADFRHVIVLFQRYSLSSQLSVLVNR